MKPPVFDQTENLALADAGQSGGNFRREHLDRRSALRAKRGHVLRPSSANDDCFFDFKGDFRFSFHSEKSCLAGALGLKSIHSIDSPVGHFSTALASLKPPEKVLRFFWLL